MIQIQREVAGVATVIKGIIGIAPINVNTHKCELGSIPDTVTIVSLDQLASDTTFSKKINDIPFTEFILSDGGTPSSVTELIEDINEQLTNETNIVGGASLAAKAFTNGGFADCDYGSIMQINNNATEYHGCEQLLQAGRIDKIEIPYRSGNFTAGEARIYVIILDKDDNKLAYKRLDLTSLPAEDGQFIVQLDSDVIIPVAGIYTVVIGRRGWSSSARRCEIAAKHASSSFGKIWVAHSSNNASLNTVDTSLIDWSTITTQPDSRVPYAIIYKY